MLKQFRKDLKIRIEDISSFSLFKNKSTIYFVEAHFKTNKLFRYLLFLRMKGVNLNKFFDKIIEEEKNPN